ncbi:LEA type 2 family protein [Planctomycetales bacterium ZRK34]|nr:LEA type 2 family protein [Planctomycetales bacterium ZRK34]
MNRQSLCHRRTLLSLVVALMLLATGGCETVQSVLNNSPKPGASVAGVRLADLSLQKVDLLFDVDVSNPYSVPLPLTNLNYALASGGNEFLSGKADVAGSVPAGGSKRVTVPATVTFVSLANTLGAVKPGSVLPYDAKMNLSVDAPLGPVSLPIRKSGQLPVPAVPKVELASMQWKTLTLSEAAAVMKLNVENTNQFDIDLGKLGYALQLGGKSIAAGGVDKSVSFGKGQTREIEIPISFSPSNLGLAALNMLRGKGASYSIGGDMAVNTPFGPMNMPYQRSGQTTFLSK